MDRLKLEYIAVEWKVIPVDCPWAGEMEGSNSPGLEVQARAEERTCRN